MWRESQIGGRKRKEKRGKSKIKDVRCKKHKKQWCQEFAPAKPGKIF